jgi:hypothetical protein
VCGGGRACAPPGNFCMSNNQCCSHVCDSNMCVGPCNMEGIPCDPSNVGCCSGFCIAGKCTRWN